MHFVSFTFLCLLAIVLLARVTIGRQGREVPYLGVLLVASLVFYAWHVPGYLGLLLFSTVVDFAAGRGLAKTGSSALRRRLWLLASLGANLGLLALFKYADFFLSEVAQALRVLGFEPSLPVLGLALPMGISFYTFQSMSYTIDVYRGVLRPMDSFWRFLLYVSFFPQLVAGPIVRAREFLPQIERRRRIHLRGLGEGLYLIVRGYFLKMVVADNLAVVVDDHWQSAMDGSAPSALTLATALAFSLQIFADFAGYSSIARGLAILLGFRLPLNFDSPYIAGSFSGFWRRWHITLSTWLRDYLYIPLGGNRRGPRRTYVNLALVMLLGGLWHGANTTFVLWGALHGSFLALERLLGLERREERRSFALRVSWFLLVQLGVLVTWVAFRATDATEALQGIGNLFAFRAGGVGIFPRWSLVLLGLPVLAIHLRTLFGERDWMRGQGPRERAVAMGVMLYLVLTAHGASDAFLYFQF